jgi:23S rRNA maturation mini-RNase III
MGYLYLSGKKERLEELILKAFEFVEVKKEGGTAG